MSILKYFKNIPRSPPNRATGLKCNFFFQIRNEVPGKKKALSPSPRATAAGPGPQARQGACRPPRGRPGVSPL